MTKTEIIQALMNDYLDCVFRSASPDDPSSYDEYLDGRARGVLYAIQLLKQNESHPKSQPKHFPEG